MWPVLTPVASLSSTLVRRWAAGAIVAFAVGACGTHSSRDPVLSQLVSVLSSQDCFSQPVHMLTPRQTPATPVRLAQMATKRASIGCTPTTSTVVYLSFHSRRQLRAALRRYRRALHGDVCAIGHAVFFYGSLYDPSAAYYMADSCGRMKGFWLPSGQPVSASL